MNYEPLGKHAELIRGITFKPTDKIDVGDEDAVVCMRTKNVQVSLDESDLIAVPRSLVGGEKKMLRCGDILVSSANSWNLVGKCCPVPELAYAATAGGFISILRPTDGKLDASYLYRWFSSERVQATVRSLGNQTTNISNLDHKRTLKLEMPLPPLAEQKRIAGILDAADALRAKRREALAQLDTLLQATFLDLFGDPVTNPKGWKTQTLDRLCFGISDIDHNMPKAVEHGVPFISAKDLMDDGSISFEDVKMISQSDYERLARKGRPQKGDIIYSRIGAKLGKARLVDVSFNFLASYSCCTIKPNNDLVDRRFLCHLLDSPSILRQRAKMKDKLQARK